MQRMALILAVFLVGLTGALAQNVTVIGPITPGDCPQFSSTTVIKDGGFPCSGAAGGPAGGVLSGTYPNPSFSGSAFANPTGAVGLTSVPGTAPTAMRSDAAPALSAPVQSALTGTNNGVALGTGAFGFGTTAPGTNSQALFGNTGAPPAFRQPAFADLTGTATNAQITPGAANTVKGTLNGSTMTDLALPSCSAVGQVLQYISGTGFSCTSSATQAPVVASRAFAITQNLSSFSAIKTLGYAAPGDGGGATFKNVGSATLVDTYINVLPAIATAGSGLTNGSYSGVAFVNGTGVGCEGSAVVSGGVLASIQISVPCVGYKAGDTLTIPVSFIGGTGTAPTLTVSSVSTPTGSFTDSAGTHFQIVTDAGNFPNILQFGAVANWNGTDTGATNNAVSLWNAIAFAAFPNGAASANVTGNQLIVPKGPYMTCGGFLGTIWAVPVPEGVWLRGPGQGGATLRHCSADAASIHFFELCDAQAGFGQFGCRVSDMTVNDGAGANSRIAVFYISSGQQFPLVDSVEIAAGSKTCFFIEKGSGGAANIILQNFDCEQLSSSSNDSFVIAASIGGAQVKVFNAVFGCAPSTCASNVFTIDNGSGVNGIFDTVHIEGHTSAGTIAGGSWTVFKNFTITNNCTTGFTLTATNPNNVTSFENIASSCTTETITNGHSGGTSLAGNIGNATRFNP